jgi:hypothetical protein
VKNVAEKLHEPMVHINDTGMIEVSCTCGRMKMAVGGKRTCVGAWDSHLALLGVSPKDAGSLNLLLNAILDSPGGATWRDLSEFPAAIADRIRAGRKAAESRVAAPAPQWFAAWAFPEPGPAEPPPAEADKPAVDEPAEEEPLVMMHQMGKVALRRTMARPVSLAFEQANIDAVAEGVGRLTNANRALMGRAFQMVGASVRGDLFINAELRREFAAGCGIAPRVAGQTEAAMEQLLVDDPGARWRMRRTIAILRKQGGTEIYLPSSWQRVLDTNRD